MYCINYVVKKGDTLYSISRNFQVGLDAIMAANPLVDVYNLMVGEVLCIPVALPSNNYQNVTTYLVEEGDTLESVLAKNQINLADLLQFTELGAIYLMPGTTLQLPMLGEAEPEPTM